MMGEAFAVDISGADPWSLNHCPACGSAATMIFDDDERAEHWGRCFKCMHFWERTTMKGIRG